MKIFHSLILLIVVAYVPSAWSQCSTGVDTGGQCIPPDQLYDQNSPQQAQPAQPEAVWATRWGAIVIDNDTGQSGSVVNYASKSEAVDAAMHDCQIHGGVHCKLQLAYHNQCAAIASGDTAHFSGSGPTKANAEAYALHGCGKGTTNCTIYYSVSVRPPHLPLARSTRCTTRLT